MTDEHSRREFRGEQKATEFCRRVSRHRRAFRLSGDRCARVSCEELTMSATLKIPYAQPSFLGAEDAYLVEAFRSTWISGGTFVDRFEEDFRRYCGTRYAVTASNGTTALHMAYLALGLRHGDEVIVPGFGFLA